MNSKVQNLVPLCAVNRSDSRVGSRREGSHCLSSTRRVTTTASALAENALEEAVLEILRLF